VSDLRTTIELRQEIKRRRGELANYAQELRRIREESLTWALACDCNCPACKNLFEVIRDTAPSAGHPSDSGS